MVVGIDVAVVCLLHCLSDERRMLTLRYVTLRFLVCFCLFVCLFFILSSLVSLTTVQFKGFSRG